MTPNAGCSRPKMQATPVEAGLVASTGGVPASSLCDLQGQKPGDHVLFKVEMDCVAVMSACPHDLSPINGANGPKDVHCQVFEAV